MQHLTEDGFTLLLAACVRQAVEDVQMGYHSPTRPDAHAFLIAAGLLSPDGDLDPRLMTPRTRQGRPSHRKQAA